MGGLLRSHCPSPDIIQRIACSLMSPLFQTLLHPVGRTGDTWVNFCTLYSILLMYLPVSRPIPCCFISYTSIIYSNVCMKQSSLLGLLFQNCLGCFCTSTLSCDVRTYPFNRPGDVTRRTPSHKGLQASWPVSKTPRNPGQCWGEREAALLGGGRWSFHDPQTHPPSWWVTKDTCLLVKSF